MKKLELNKIPFDISNGIITPREAVNIISSFIMQNYPVFGLQKYDEDFREDIILSILEKGEHLISTFKKEQGDFFTYLYCYILSMVRTKLRTSAKQAIKESINFTEYINVIKEQEYNYNSINYNNINSPKIPYNFKTVSEEELRKIYDKVKGDKKLLVIALKSAFYLDDNQITKICNIYKIDKNDFYKTIEYFKNLLLDKADKKQKLQERRNYAYYHHKKYEVQLNLLKHSDLNNNSEELMSNMGKKEKKHKSNWANLNSQLKKGLMLLRPTNKVLARILGICERQVTYYINCTKNKEKKDKEKE